MPGPVAFLGSMHACPMTTPAIPPVPHVGGPIVLPSDPTFLVMGFPLAGMGAMATCAGVPPVDPIAMGMPTFLTGTPAAGIGAVTSHGGMVAMGDPTFIVT